MKITCDPGAWVHPDVVWSGQAHVGFNSCVGYGELGGEPTTVGDGVRIGAFCVVEHGVQIGAGVEIDHYCRIARGVSIGAGTRILYRAQLFADVRIGRDCVIAGELVDRAIVGDEVTFQGNTAHSHRDPTGDWDETEEPSPTIESGSVVGVNALILGGIRIGPRAYVAAGEIARTNVPEGMVLIGARLRHLAEFRGLIKVRGA